MDRAPRREWISIAASVPVAVLAAFFVAFNAVFTDAFGVADHVGLMMYVTAAYGVLGLIFGLVWPTRGRHWVFWLVWPAVLALIAYSFSEPGHVLWHLVVAVLSMVGATLGSLAGSGLRHGHSTRQQTAA